MGNSVALLPSSADPSSTSSSHPQSKSQCPTEATFKSTVQQALRPDHRNSSESAATSSLPATTAPRRKPSPMSDEEPGYTIVRRTMTTTTTQPDPKDSGLTTNAVIGAVLGAAAVGAAAGAAITYFAKNGNEHPEGQHGRIVEVERGAYEKIRYMNEQPAPHTYGGGGGGEYAHIPGQAPRYAPSAVGGGPTPFVYNVPRSYSQIGPNEVGGSIEAAPQYYTPSAFGGGGGGRSVAMIEDDARSRYTAASRYLLAPPPALSEVNTRRGSGASTISHSAHPSVVSCAQTTAATRAPPPPASVAPSRVPASATGTHPPPPHSVAGSRYRGTGSNAPAPLPCAAGSTRPIVVSRAQSYHLGMNGSRAPSVAGSVPLSVVDPHPQHAASRYAVSQVSSAAQSQRTAAPATRPPLSGARSESVGGSPTGPRSEFGGARTEIPLGYAAHAGSVISRAAPPPQAPPSRVSSQATARPPPAPSTVWPGPPARAMSQVSARQIPLPPSRAPSVWDGGEDARSIAPSESVSSVGNRRPSGPHWTQTKESGAYLFDA